MTSLIGMMALMGELGETQSTVHRVLGALSFFLAFFGFCHTIRSRKVIQLDISGGGQIRMSFGAASSGSCQEANWPHVTEQGVAVRLLQDSTLWSNLLLLRLQAESGKVVVMPILFDCVSRDGFRALSVACRWIAARDDSSRRKNS